MALLLDGIEQILAGIVAQPLPKTLADLQRLADAQPTSAGPLLAMTMVASFSRYNFKDAQGFLKKSAALVKRGGDDPESAFAAALFNAISCEFSLFDIERPIAGQVTVAQLRARAKAQQQARAAIEALKAAVARVRTSTLAQTIYAMLCAFSRANSTDSKEYSSGVAALSRLRTRSASSDLAAFFLIYAHRRAKRYPQAVRVAKELEKRQPNSVLVKEVIGSCYFHMRDLSSAEKYYRQGLALSKQDPTVQLGLARIMERLGDIVAARKLLDQATKADAEGRLSKFLKVLGQELDIRERLQ